MMRIAYNAQRTTDATNSGAEVGRRAPGNLLNSNG